MRPAQAGRNNKMWLVVASLLPNLQGKRDIPADWTVLPVGDMCGIEHPLCGDYRIGIGVFIIHIDDFSDTLLDDGLCTFVAGEQGRIDLRALHVGPGVV